MIHRLLDVVATKARISPKDVGKAYQLLFSREPENASVAKVHADGHPDIWSLLGSLMESREFKDRMGQNHNPRTTLDWYSLLERFQQTDLTYRRGYITNYLGVPTNVSYLGHLRGSPGFVEGIPISGDFHSSVSEWIAGLRGVELSGDDFVVVELGAGWGPWMVNLCRAAQIKGAKRTFAIGCEADELHCKFIFEHFLDNGFTDREYKVYQGAIGPEKGVALFPVSEDSANDWGMRPIFCATEEEAKAITSNPQVHADYRGHRFQRFHRVPCYALPDVVSGVEHVDVLHIDIQGGEYELLRHNLDLVTRMVGYLVIGTHSRPIEGELMVLLANAGWKLEVEEPCAFDIHDPNFSPQIDGTQGWRNLHIHP